MKTSINVLFLQWRIALGAKWESEENLAVEQKIHNYLIAAKCFLTASAYEAFEKVWNANPSWKGPYVSVAIKQTLL